MSRTATSPAAGTGATAAAGPAGRRSRRPGGRRDAAAAVVAAVVAALVFLVVRRSLIDDAYITLSYARNLAEHFQWGLTSYRTANSATSPLNVLVLGLGTFVVRDAIWGLGLVFVLLNTVQAWGLSRLGRRLDLAPGAGLLAWLAVALSPLMLSIVGMEMTLAVTLLVWLVVSAVEDRVVLFGLLTAALGLTRLDLLVFPLVLLLTTRALRRRVLLVAAVALAASLPWYLFSWLALGALLPDTLIIKTGNGVAWGPWSFWNGPLLYYRAYETATVLTLVPAAVGGLALLAWFATGAWRRAAWRGMGPVAALGVAGVLHYCAYWQLSPPPFHWYYAPSACALILTAVLFLGRAAAARGQAGDEAGTADVGPQWSTGRRVVAGLAAVAVGALLAVDIGFLVTRPLPWVQSVISTNWATAAGYQAIGDDLRESTRGQVVGSPGEIGTLAYYCECDIVDVFSDRGAIVPLVEQREREAGPVMRAVLRVNFARLDRDQQPAEQTRALVYTPGPDAGGGWPVSSTWLGPGSFRLEEVEPNG